MDRVRRDLVLRWVVLGVAVVVFGENLGARRDTLPSVSTRGTVQSPAAS